MVARIGSETARRWVKRWDAQQEGYVADREERFAVVADVVEHATRDTSRPSVVDLGCGPGSLSARLVRRLPRAEIVGVDADPLLLGLGRGHYDHMRFVEADLTDPDWTEQAAIQTLDAAVSATALHWIDVPELKKLYARLVELIRPGGVFVNADHFPIGSPTIDGIAQHVRDSRAARVGVDDNEEWGTWWDAVRADPELAGLLDERSESAIQHGGTNGLSAPEQRDLLLTAGFSEVGTVWQSGDDTVIVAVR